MSIRLVFAAVLLSASVASAQPGYLERDADGAPTCRFGLDPCTAQGDCPTFCGPIGQDSMGVPAPNASCHEREDSLLCCTADADCVVYSVDDATDIVTGQCVRVSAFDGVAGVCNFGSGGTPAERADTFCLAAGVDVNDTLIPCTTRPDETPASAWEDADCDDDGVDNSAEFLGGCSSCDATRTPDATGVCVDEGAMGPVDASPPRDRAGLDFRGVGAAPAAPPPTPVAQARGLLRRSS